MNIRPLWLGSSCSLLHSPIDLSKETLLDAEVKSWFAFALQKCAELALLTQALNASREARLAELVAYSAPIRTRWQIALSLRDEVEDLEKAEIGIIQIYEPALRAGLPLRRADRQAYLQWAFDSFKLSAAVAQNDIQIHTHMCYCEFNDIMDSMAALDDDVITIETFRSDMELLESFEDFSYPNEISPGVYDIH